MTTSPPKLTVLAILSVWIVSPVAAGDLIQRDSPVALASPTSEPLVLADGVLARERVEVDAGVLASVPETLWLELEPGETRLAVLVDSVRTRDGGLVWRGRFIEDEPDYRTIILSLHDGLVSGSFEAGEVGYSLRPTPGGGSELSTMTVDRQFHCAVEDATPDEAVHRQPSETGEPPPRQTGSAAGPSTAPRRIAAAADDGRTLAILVLYVPSVGERWGGRRYVVSYAHHAIDSFNTALANSRIDGAAFLAGVEEWLPTTGHTRPMLVEVAESGAVGALRDQAGADLVVILTDHSSFSTRQCGLANLMSNDRKGPQMAALAFSITNVDCDTHNHWIFIHEIGHNLGGNHLPKSSGTPPPLRAAFPYAYAHRDGRFNSVMAGGRHDRLVFANPTVLFDGRPTGIEGERDNARTLQQTIPIAAAFRSDGDELPPENVPPPVPPPPTVTPGAPTELRGTVLSATAVQLRWKDNTSDDIGYRIEVKKGSGSTFQTVDEVPGNTVVHVVEGLDPATRYRFRVLALGVQLNSPPSNEIELTTRDAPPAAPVGLTATPTPSGAITLGWEAVERATGYEAEVRAADPAADRAALPVVLGPDGASVDGLEPATPYTFRVRALNAVGASEWSAAASATTARPAGPCVAGGPTLCLLDGRFEVGARWRNPHPPFGHGLAAAQAAPGSDVTGLFTFFDPQNVELLVKMLDARSVNDAFWHFYGALSDVEYWISVFDTTTGTSRTYHNQPFSLCGRGDTSAFPQPPGAPATTHSPLLAVAGATVSPSSRATAPTDTATGACSPGEHALCLAGGRFRVEVDWVNPHAPDSHGVGNVFAGGQTDLYGHFWFFTPDNLELSVKILDGRALNGHFWIFWGGLSDVGYTLHVTDTESGDTQELTNPPLTLCGGAVTDLL